jgi:peptide/nickel transport system substrate-binding protein
MIKEGENWGDCLIIRKEGKKMKRTYQFLGVTICLVLSLAILLSSYSTASSATKAVSTTEKAVKTMTAAEQPQYGGIYNMMIRFPSDVFGYPPRISGSGRDYAPPFFDHLLYIGDDGQYKPGLALSWDASKDGKAITLKLRQGVTFHDGTPFNAQAVKSNIDNLILSKRPILTGITSVDVVDDYTVKLNLPEYNNLILFQFSINPATYMYSPEALKKNGEDWANTHPVGTGPFILKDYQPNVSLTLVTNPNYWQKGLPYLDGIKISVVSDDMTQMMTIKAGQANAIYDIGLISADQLRGDGYPLQIAQTGSSIGINFDIKNSEIFSKRQVREAIEYAIDKEAICNGPGRGLYIPVYQINPSSSPDYNKACLPRKYDPAKAKKLLAEAGYPNGFSFKLFILDRSWKDGFVAVQSYLAQVGIKMEINYVNISAFGLIRAGGKIEPGAAAFHNFTTSSNTLYTLDTYWRSDSEHFPYVVKPAGIDQLIDQAKLSRDPAAINKVNQQIIKLIYDDETFVPLWLTPRMAVVDKSVRNTGWFINSDPDNNQLGTRTWLKK